MATPKKIDKKTPDPEDDDLDQDGSADLPGRKKPVDEDDDFDEPFDDLEYDNLGDYDDEDDDY